MGHLWMNTIYVHCSISNGLNMTDRYQSSSPKNRGPHCIGSQPEQTDDNQCLKRNPLPGRVDIIALVRSLQRTAGKTDCFRTGNADCDTVDCDWRTYCLGTPADRAPNARRHPKKSD
jgi:hypothetical protein